MSGRVYIVGAGPGDPGLLTARAVELIAKADVILYDRLIGDGALDAARSGAELIYVGKEGGGAAVPQGETQALIARHAQAGKTVVRLKGGDPFVFGRGGEEAQALRAAGIAYEVVPGVTAGLAAPAYAGIPVTHRDVSSAVALVTAHEDPAKGESALDWDALAAFPGTLVLYMGVGRLASVCERLIAAGRDGREAAAMIERGTLPGQRVIRAELASLAERATQAGVRAPAIAVVGAVAALAGELDWVEEAAERPLAGRTVAVTRARAQTSELGARLAALGARVIEAPTIRIEPRAVDLPSMGDFDLVCLTSPNGVRILFERMAERGEDARALAGATLAAIGPGTARALREFGVIADVVPERFVAEGLAASLEGHLFRRALIARAAQARDVLPDALRKRGIDVEVLALYDTVAEPLDEGRLAAVRAADYVTFTSSSTVRFFFEAADLGAGTRIVSIGPVTSKTLREHGHEPHVEASSHDIEGLLESLIDDVR